MMEFDVIVKKIRDFHVIVKNVSLIDSLVLTLKTQTYKITANIVEYIYQRLTLSHKSKIIIAEWMDFINPRPEIHVCNNMDTNMSSSEYFNNTKITSNGEMRNSIASRESISTQTKSKLDIILDPTVGIFRKLVEFDSLTLGELDELTLSEMDYIEETISDIEKNMRSLINL